MVGGGFDYLPIGNSITVHGLADYWWDDDRGMAATQDGRDYVSALTAELEKKLGSATVHPYNFSAWETNGHDRSEFLALLDPYLSDDLDLVTLQLGENAIDLSTWESDCRELIRYVEKGAPNAKIVVVGDFWSNGDRDAAKARAAAAEGVLYASLDGICDNPDFYIGLGAMVLDDDGGSHTVDHEGVAMHPGDKGMAAIAQRIIDTLEMEI